MEDAQDLTQESFLVLWQRRSETRDPKSFLYGVAKRLYYAFLRTRQSDRAILGETTARVEREHDESLSIAQVPNPSIDANELTAELLSRMCSLSQKQRKVLQLRYIENLSQSQVAEKLALSIRTVRTHESRALAALQALGKFWMG